MSFYSRFVSLTIGDDDGWHYIHEFNHSDYTSIKHQFEGEGRGEVLCLILSGIRSLQKVTIKNMVLIQDIRDYIPGSKKFCPEDMCEALGECLADYDPALVSIYTISYSNVKTVKIEELQHDFNKSSRYGEVMAAVDLIITRADAEDFRDDSAERAFEKFLEKWQKMEQGIEDPDNETTKDSDLNSESDQEDFSA